MSHEAGSPAHLIIKDLIPGTQYHMAIRNSDKCNTSEISNIASMTTRTNEPPFVSNPFRDRIMRDVASETRFYIGDVFSDPDLDELTYKILVTNPSIALARVSDDYLYINPLRSGITTMRLAADDGNSGCDTATFNVVVTLNHAPVFSGFATDLTLIPNIAVEISLENVYDPEGDYPLSFSVLPFRSDIITATVSGDKLTINPRRHGDVALQIRASDAHSASSIATINITVEQKYTSDKTDQLLAYPNPTSDILWYSFKLESEMAAVIIRIMDSSGRTVYQTQRENLSEGAHYNNINIQDWYSGIYYIQLVKNGKLYDMKKILKL